MLQVFTTISCFVAIALAATEHNCNDLQGKSITTFEAERYTGKWYLARYTLNSWRTMEIHRNYLQCQSLNYQLNSDSNGYDIQTKNSISPTATEYYIDIFENLVNFTTKFDTEKTSHMEMNGGAKPGDTKELVILDTDYDHYAVEYICMSHGYKMVRLLTRTATPPTTSMNSTIDSLLSLTVLTGRSLADIPQINCK